MNATLQDRFDYVVVGAGTAGCVLAARLSEDRATRVCLIEAGGWDRHPFIHVPALVGAAIARRSLNWRFMTEPQAGLEQRRIPLPRGRVVGGSGSINGMVYFRGQPHDYDAWAAAGNPGWSWREVLPYFLRSEDNPEYRDSPYHGQGGPIRVAYIPKPNPLNRVFQEAFAQVGGYPACQDFAGPAPEGYGYRQGTIRAGRRDSTAAAYLRPARSRPNLTVLTHAPVARVLIENGRASGVEAIVGGLRRPLYAARETVLCAGAIQSPQILMLSGIGPPEDLRRHGIPVRVAAPGVGAHYRDHLSVPVVMETSNTESYGLSFATLPRAALNLLQYAFGRHGPLASNVFESTAFIRSSPDRTWPDLQLVFQPARRNRGTFPLPLGHGFVINCVGLYPRSRGRIVLASADPLSAPRVEANLLAERADLAPLLAGLKLARRLFAAAAFERCRAVEVMPGPAVRSDAELEAYVRRTAVTVHHPVSTCRMGVEADAVVDAGLRVRGVASLRVADGSIFPVTIGGNTNAPIVMVAEKAADLLLGRAAPAPVPQT
ncbi:MAG: GMC family oxidoreductase N-terminal domain-containing protein [Gammaproteobacteria bacterium]|nr:GMC family oxidoreductase N-terminal domain-containing protein [Gammaproteobacteria bacterium]